MLYRIQKTFDWSMGHRVHNQQLNDVFSCGSSCKCKNLHGHSYSATISIMAEKLHNNMVIDFTDLKFIKAWIDRHLDHKFLLDEEDPMLEGMGLPSKQGLKEATNRLSVYSEDCIAAAYDEHEEDEGIELVSLEDHVTWLSSYVFMDGVPTSEEIAKLIYDYAVSELSTVDNYVVESVTVSESPSSAATYKGASYA